jgi:hypothetical protein
MRIALLTGTAAALALLATAAARAETVYVTDPDAVVVPGTVYAAEPEYVVRDRPYVQDRYVQDRSYVVVAPRRERVIVVPRREVVIDRPEYVAPRDSFAYRGTARTGGYYTAGYNSGSSCMIDRNGFERCY